MRDLGMNKVLIVNVINLLGLDDFSFFKKLESYELAILFILGNFDFTESTFDS